MNSKIREQIEKLKALLEDSPEETLEQLRDDALLLADYIEEYIYQRDAQRIVEELLEETKEDTRERADYF
ncbi:MAG: hypothetical protein RBT80_22020 [Candidatus Vecturithrix sp.]|jgi:hypothetical protein|nr:hypothetical protein [Candidatus Vecturithrix sp.]